jgi:hypothetical protein
MEIRWTAAGFRSGTLGVPRDPYRMLIDLREYTSVAIRPNEVPAVRRNRRLLDAQIVAIRRTLAATLTASQSAKAAATDARNEHRRRCKNVCRRCVMNSARSSPTMMLVVRVRLPPSIDGRIPAMVERLTLSPGLPGELVVELGTCIAGG